MSDERTISVSTIANGIPTTASVEPRLLLSDFIRHRLGLTGTHVGCEHGVCGACTVLVDGAPARSCLMLAAQADGKEITTIEGIESEDPDRLGEVQRALATHHGLQCGFCTPGFVISMTAVLREPEIDDERMSETLGGHVCRCTGYQGIRSAAEELVAHRRKESA